MSERATPIWPFPGADPSRWWEAYPPHNLPPPRFKVGDRVATRWGSATVLTVHDWEHFGSRGYHVRDDSSSAPEGFGQTWGEADMQPLIERPAEPDEDDEAVRSLDLARDRMWMEHGIPPAGELVPVQGSLF